MEKSTNSADYMSVINCSDQRTIPETTNVRCTSSNCESVFMLFVRTMCASAMKAVGDLMRLYSWRSDRKSNV